MSRFILSLTFLTLFFVTDIALTENIYVDRSPTMSTDVGIDPGDTGRDPWDLQFSFDVSGASGQIGNTGGEFDGTFFYSTRWQSNLIHQYDIDGNLVKEFSIPGVSGLRELAYDGTYFYGGAGGGTMWQMDFENETLVGSISGDFECRAIAYNHDDDLFYVSNWGDPVWVVDWEDGVIDLFDLVELQATYGFAYQSDPDGIGDPCLWIFDQGSGSGSPQYIHQWDLTTGQFTGEMYDVMTDFPGTGGLAGGLFLTTDFLLGTTTIGGLLQTENPFPNMMFCYEAPTLGHTIETEILALNGTIFEPGERAEYEVTITNTGGSAVEVTASVYATGPVDFTLTLQGPLTFTLGGGRTISRSLSAQIPAGAPTFDVNICIEAIPTRGGRSTQDCYKLSIREGEETITGGLCPAYILQAPAMPPPLARLLVGTIWVCDADLDSIHHISSEGMVLSSIPAPCGSPQALSINGYGGDPIGLGLYVSCTDNDYIYHIGLTGVVMDSFPAAGDDPECLGLTDHTTEGEYTIGEDPPMTTAYIESVDEVWTTHESELCRFDPSTETYTSTIPAPGPSASGLEWAASFFEVSMLWVCDNEVDSIYKVAAADGEILERFPSPGTDPTGIAAGLIIPILTDSTETWDGFVLTLYESENLADTLYTVGATSGEVLESYYLPPSCE